MEKPTSAVDRILAKGSEVAVLPQVVFKIMEMTGSENASAQSLETAIVVDPGFSARILTQANSAYFALPRKVTSIREAIMFVGFKAVRQLAMTIGVFDMFLGKNDRGSLRRRGWWRQSLDTAVCAKAIAELNKRIDPDVAFTCGLLHLIGKTLMDRCDSEMFDKVMALVDRGAPDFMAEKAVFGCDHIEVNIAASEHWGFPEELIAGLDYMRPHEGEAEESELIRALTAISNRIARVVVEGVGTHDAVVNLPDWAVKTLGWTPEQTENYIAAGKQAIADSKALMNR